MTRAGNYQNISVCAVLLWVLEPRLIMTLGCIHNTCMLHTYDAFKLSSEYQKIEGTLRYAVIITNTNAKIGKAAKWKTLYK